MSIRSWSLALAALALAGTALAQHDGPGWTPNEWKDVSTLKLCTTSPGESEHCFPVWLVVLDDEVYVRLGSRAAERMQKNVTAPHLPVEINDHRFENVRATAAPDYVDRVAKAMADKYTSDIFVRLFSHPLTMRLRPEAPPDEVR
jgi:hypothetical protein